MCKQSAFPESLALTLLGGTCHRGWGTCLGLSFLTPVFSFWFSEQYLWAIFTQLRSSERKAAEIEAPWDTKQLNNTGPRGCGHTWPQGAWRVAPVVPGPTARLDR